MTPYGHSRGVKIVGHSSVKENYSHTWKKKKKNKECDKELRYITHVLPLISLLIQKDSHKVSIDLNPFFILNHIYIIIFSCI